MWRRWVQAGAVGLIFTVCLQMMTGFSSECVTIRENVLRLHILANSDSEEDQQVKLAVRDRILDEYGEAFHTLHTKEDAQRVTEEMLSRIARTAYHEIEAQGYYYPVQVEMSRSFFETREYDDFVLPAGQYDAVRISIGEAEGRNWWCVLYPALCLPAAEAGNDFEASFGEDGADILTHAENYKVEFAVVEVWEKIKAAFS